MKKVWMFMVLLFSFVNCMANNLQSITAFMELQKEQGRKMELVAQEESQREQLFQVFRAAYIQYKLGKLASCQEEWDALQESCKGDVRTFELYQERLKQDPVVQDAVQKSRKR